MKNYTLNLLALKRKTRDTQRIAAYVISHFKFVTSIKQVASIWYDLYKANLRDCYNIDLSPKQKNPTEEQQTIRHILNQMLVCEINDLKQVSKWYEDIFNEYELLINPLTGLPCAPSDFIKAKKEYNSLF